MSLPITFFRFQSFYSQDSVIIKLGRGDKKGTQPRKLLGIRSQTGTGLECVRNSFLYLSPEV